MAGFLYRQTGQLLKLTSLLSKPHSVSENVTNLASLSNRFITTNARLLAAVQNVKVVENGKKVNVSWDDGKSSNFHSLWLRFQCSCVSCREESSGLFRCSPAHIPLDLTIQDAKITNDGVHIKWKEEDHHGNFTEKFLEEFSYTNENLQAKKSAGKPLYKPQNGIPEVSWEEVEASDQGFYKWLKHINTQGLCLVRGVPTEPGYVEKVIEKIGPVVHTPYGKIFAPVKGRCENDKEEIFVMLFEVKTSDDPVNAAYTSVALFFHQDLPVLEGQPGLQFLHCLKFDDTVKGGKTRFLDAYHVVEKFRKDHPEEFQILCDTPVRWKMEYDNSDYPVNMDRTRPIILLNDHNEVVSLVWHTYMHSPLEAPEEVVEKFYRAYQLLGRAMENSPDVLEVRLTPGDLIVFNNRRMVHGRSAYEEGGHGSRHLQGGYLSADDYKSRLQVLAKRVGENSSTVRIGHNDWR